ncbi:uncharacterized protein TRIVIDRAFT_154011 [Trichoderma virens Gv29-8]|uniref:FHA domain-containing protein n=1 Tax=Hypocrea virens (strain Gv29-8 / FGSC 10586) TaxID=413071 RepID=G9MXS8_HYPVG|nr:uncharacterized protein TRIVIDRAFT_154011 [Trichoderma virens Gv29-8]EHK20689.1 hypothetical protein TRIVIDRAFT_154011 [Trichoderma virens Gv29-8]
MDSTRKPAAEPALPAPASASTTTTTTTTTTTASTSTSASASTTSVSSLGSPLKRPAPSLLPPFEPSSSPGLPRPSKRQNVSGTGAHLRYPTPVPTSSTGILSSSPLREKLSVGLVERTPLSAVPSIELNENGEMVLMGRSSNSSHFQLSANRLISRVHVKARYIQGSTPLEANKIEITCNGWNGLKLHCQGRSWELLKGDSFTSETEGTEIMVDVHDARVLIQWPKRSSSGADSNGLLSDASWEDSPPRSQTRNANLLQVSPLRRATRIQSPDSPTPAPRRRSVVAADDDNGIEIYEDDDEDYQPDSDERDEEPDVGVSMRTEATASFTSGVDSDEEDESNPDEENDPIIHSFGPYGANISGRLASITTKSPRVQSAKRPLNKGSAETLSKVKRTSRDQRSPSEERLPQPKEEDEEEEDDEEEEPTRIPSEADAAISNHVVNQLAYSRLSSTPLSTIMHNLPAEQIKDISRDALRLLIETTPCIGIIKRQGKDAAGKALESEYYYIPEDDTDMQRRAAVVDGLRKPSLRACRKQHKQYYWKRPKTP